MSQNPSTTDGGIVYTDNSYNSDINFGTGYSVSMMVITLLVGVVSSTLNLGVVLYYWKSCKELIPFVYLTLSVSDLLTSCAAILHALVFALLLGNSEKAAYKFALFTSLITVLTFRLSSFISLTIAMIRSINIASPFTIIRKKMVIGCILGYMVFWIAYAIADFAIVLHKLSDSKNPKHLLIAYFYEPRTPNLIIQMFELHVKEQALAMTRHLECSIFVGYIGLTIFLPTFLTLLAMSHQIYYLQKPSNASSRSDRLEKRRITLTIVMITSIFIVTCIVTFVDPLITCFTSTSTQYKTIMVSYALGSLPLFLNALLNPFILIIRGSNLREHIITTLVSCCPRRSTTGSCHISSRHNTILSILASTGSPKNRIFPARENLDQIQLNSPNRDVSFQTSISEHVVY